MGGATPRDVALHYTRKSEEGAGERAQQLRALAALAKDRSWVSSTHIRQLTTSCNSNLLLAYAHTQHILNTASYTQ